LSVTVQVTVVVPIGKVAGALFVTEATPQLSEVAGAESTTVAKQDPVSALTFTAAAHMMVGFSLSVTVTLWVHVFVLPALSVTVQVTVVVPIGKVAGALFVTEATPQLSPVVGTERTTAVKHEPEAAATVTFTGHEIVGFSLSVTITF
jgi:hypothetical protein